ncbi:unnamed protein product [Orchesella dallaii]|uniref:Uncharacterized protein n=1 Tax=Orchesella dallaii TaxID=48710 RepID=A0ABP1Q6A9_9HEXA
MSVYICLPSNYRNGNINFGIYYLRALAQLDLHNNGRIKLMHELCCPGFTTHTQQEICFRCPVCYLRSNSMQRETIRGPTKYTQNSSFLSCQTIYKHPGVEYAVFMHVKITN